MRIARDSQVDEKSQNEENKNSLTRRKKNPERANEEHENPGKHKEIRGKTFEWTNGEMKAKKRKKPEMKAFLARAKYTQKRWNNGKRQEKRKIKTNTRNREWEWASKTATEWKWAGARSL